MCLKYSYYWYNWYWWRTYVQYRVIWAGVVVFKLLVRGLPDGQVWVVCLPICFQDQITMIKEKGHGDKTKKRIATYLPTSPAKNKFNWEIDFTKWKAESEKGWKENQHKLCFQYPSQAYIRIIRLLLEVTFSDIRKCIYLGYEPKECCEKGHYICVFRQDNVNAFI